MLGGVFVQQLRNPGPDGLAPVLVLRPLPQQHAVGVLVQLGNLGSQAGLHLWSDFEHPLQKLGYSINVAVLITERRLSSLPASAASCS
jgi:hypothetical protein